MCNIVNTAKSVIITIKVADVSYNVCYAMNADGIHETFEITTPKQTSTSNRVLPDEFKACRSFRELIQMTLGLDPAFDLFDKYEKPSNSLGKLLERMDAVLDRITG